MHVCFSTCLWVCICSYSVNALVSQPSTYAFPQSGYVAESLVQLDSSQPLPVCVCKCYVASESLLKRHWYCNAVC